MANTRALAAISPMVTGNKGDLPVPWTIGAWYSWTVSPCARSQLGHLFVKAVSPKRSSNSLPQMIQRRVDMGPEMVAGFGEMADSLLTEGETASLKGDHVSLQRLAKSKNKIPAAKPKRSTPPNMRRNSDAGTAGMGPGGRLGGTGGSRIPMPVNLRGGPPERPEEDAGSSSNSFSANS